MYVSSPRRICRKLERGEGIIGLFILGAMSVLLMAFDCGMAVVLAALSKHSLRWDEETIMTVCVAGATLPTVVLFVHFFRSFERNRAHPTYEMSIRLARRALPLRAFLGAWALVIAFALVMIVKPLPLLLDSREARDTSVKLILASAIFIISLSAAYVANGYLLCFLRCWGLPRALAKFVYRHRYAIDVSIACLMALYFTSFAI